MKTLVAMALIFLGLGHLVLHVQGSCYLLAAAPGATECRTEKGTAVKLGESVTEDCINCNCDTDGTLSCCGTGIASGMIQAPPGCDVVPEGMCDFKFVSAEDHSQECPPEPELVE